MQLVLFIEEKIQNLVNIIYILKFYIRHGYVYTQYAQY